MNVSTRIVTKISTVTYVVDAMSTTTVFAVMRVSASHVTEILRGAYVTITRIVTVTTAAHADVKMTLHVHSAIHAPNTVSAVRKTDVTQSGSAKVVINARIAVPVVMSVCAVPHAQPDVVATPAPVKVATITAIAVAMEMSAVTVMDA